MRSIGAHTRGRRPVGKFFRILGAIVLCTASAGLAMKAHAEIVPGQDKSFMVKAAEAGNAEIAASKIALEKSSDADVKEFAQKMIDQHTSIGGELKQLAMSKSVDLPAEPTVMQRTKIAVLEKLKGSTFDKRYVSMIGVSAHKDAVKLFQKEAASAKDPDVKDFAAKALPGLEQHLQMAVELQKKMDASK